MKKALSITSPTHAWGLTSYFILGFSGLAGVFNLNQQSAVIAAMGEGVADIWSTVLMLSGFGAFAAAIAASKALKPEYNLRTEMYLNVTLFFCLGYFLYVTVSVAGWRGFTTGIFAVVFILGSLFRAIQIYLEMKLIKQARAHPTEADPVMGDPRDESEQG